MESDKRYFIEGLFIIGLTIAAALFAVWVGNPGRHDDVLYRIHFTDSVSGLAVGDPVKFHGVDFGTVKTMRLDPENPRRVVVEVKLRKEAPVKTDTKASLAMKGITGTVFIELNGGNPTAQTLLAATPEGKVPEIPSETTGLKAVLDELPIMVKKIETTADKFAGMADKFSTMAQKFSAVGEQSKKVLTGVGELTEKVKENPSLLLRRPKESAETARK